jgi:heme ABC exporter ATP-binding subunit CcmA
VKGRGLLPIELRGLAFRYGRKAVLRRVDLRIEAGEVVALLGANGAGKTTLFSLLSGLMQPDDGERIYGGVPQLDIGEALRARLAHVGHRPQVYPLLTARENLELFASLRSASLDASARGEALLERLGLGAVMDQPVSTFSRGMAQRVALSRALAHQPELLILDEPFTALDPSGRGLLAKLLREVADEGSAVLLASHDIETVAAVVDRALVLEDGVIASELRVDPNDETSGRLRMRDDLARSLSAPDRLELANAG